MSRGSVDGSAPVEPEKVRGGDCDVELYRTRGKTNLLP